MSPVPMVRALLPVLGLTIAIAAQKWAETCGKSPSGVVALQQAARDVGTDLQVLLVASHPDDRYVLPAVWLRFFHGARIAVLLATRGGGGQNSAGPETGDALERIRTLETEAGCAHFGGEVWYLNRPDGGFRRTKEETFAEWGREKSLHDLVALVRRIRPDLVLTTHHVEEQHGHDLALVDLLGEAVRLAADASFATDRPAHRVAAYFTGGLGTNTPNTVTVDGDQLEANRGTTLLRLAYDVLRLAHTSPGAPPPLDRVFEPTMRFEPQLRGDAAANGFPLGRMPSLFDAGIWPGQPERARELEAFLRRDLPPRVGQREAVAPEVAAVLTELRGMLARLAAENRADSDQAAIRLQRRIESLEHLLVQLCGIQIELDVPPGTVAIAGEEFAAAVHLHVNGPFATKLGAAGLDGVEVRLESFDGREVGASVTGSQHAHATIRMPLGADHDGDPMRTRFAADRFVPPVRIRFVLGCLDTDIPILVTVPVEERAPVELSVVPRLLLLPTSRRAVQFSVDVSRNSQFPVEGELEVRAPAGYAVPQDRRRVTLAGQQRGDMFRFEVGAAAERKAGVDVIRVALGGSHVALPVHKIDVVAPPSLRVGVVRSPDDTLAGVLGVGGLGLQWSELSDADIAIADLTAFDTIVVDVRSLRDRPAARRGFRRLLEFAGEAGRRLVVFYQKDTEWNAEGEGFLGAPFAPFHVGKARVTRPDAPVRTLVPDHVLLRHPNNIRPSDWDGWDQERGLYFPSAYASQYEEVLEMHDPGQPSERGALLYARTGRGEYVYCALALWRQLKKLHPGAVRLLANLLTPSGRS